MRQLCDSEFLVEVAGQSRVQSTGSEKRREISNKCANSNRNVWWKVIQWNTLLFKKRLFRYNLSAPE